MWRTLVNSGLLMRLSRLLAAALAVSPLSMPLAAHAAVAQEAGSAMGACLAAVIDRAPVANIRIGDVAIERELNPNSCTVNVGSGDPGEVRAAVLSAIDARHEKFTPAATSWDPGQFATREAFCDLPSRKPYSVLVSTAKPGGGLVLSATVVDTKERDTRCDQNEGDQHVPSL